MSMLQERRGQPLNNEHGLEIMEAGIYAALVIAAAIAVLSLIGPKLVNAWNTINNAL